MSTPAPRWRLELDGATCDAHGICLLRCPSRIHLDEWGYAVVSDAPITDETVLGQARRAVAACPEHALRLVQQQGAPVRSRAAASDGRHAPRTSPLAHVTVEGGE